MIEEKLLRECVRTLRTHAEQLSKILSKQEKKELIQALKVITDRKKEKKLLVETRYNKVKELMELGLPKSVACDRLGLNRTLFDRNITDEQKRELKEIRYSFVKGSSCTKWRVENGSPVNEEL